VATKKATATFVEPMLLLRSSSLPDDDGWIREIKLDGYRAIAFKSAGKLHLHSRNDNDMAARYPVIAKGLAKLPDNTVVDGKLVALDEDDRPSFNLLQNYGNFLRPAPALYLRPAGSVRPGSKRRATRNQAGPFGDQGDAEAG
jgi:bifunctional non-homologous end joining protein LigD